MKIWNQFITITHGLELKEKNKYYIKRIFYFLLLFILSYIIVDYYSIICLLFGNSIELTHISSLFIIIICLFIFLILINQFFTVKKFKLLLAIMIIISIAGVLPDMIHFVIFNKPIDYISLMTFSDTNNSEVSDFINTYGAFNVYIKLFLLIILPFILLCFLPSYSLKIKVKSWKFILLSIIIFTVLILTLPRDYVQREIRPVYLSNTYKQVLVDKKLFIENIKNINHEDFGEIKINSISDNNTYILVIGESADRNRYSLYNYNRDTSPYLSKIKDELFLFDDVISPHAHTSPALELILTFGDLRNNDLKYKYGSIIDFFNSAGFKTFWISNQYKYGSYDSGYSAIANAADEKIYINTNSWQSNKTNYYDEQLVIELEKVLKENYGNKFIILHLFGSHSPYNNRYPEKFNVYKSNQYLANISPDSKYANVMKYNAYDNSIIYTDYVLKKLIDVLKQENINGYMLYFSDHGEDAGSTDKNVFYGHNESISSKPMYEIPFILWLSNKYKQENSGKVNDIKLSIHKPYQTDRLIHTIIDLSNMDNKLFKQEESIINKNFQEVKRVYGNKEYKK